MNMEGMVAEYQSLQRSTDQNVASLQQLQSQLKENDQVIKEFELLKNDSQIYKLIGPVLVKVDSVEANLKRKKVRRTRGGAAIIVGDKSRLVYDNTDSESEGNLIIEDAPLIKDEKGNLLRRSTRGKPGEVTTAFIRKKKGVKVVSKVQVQVDLVGSQDGSESEESDQLDRSDGSDTSQISENEKKRRFDYTAKKKMSISSYKHKVWKTRISDRKEERSLPETTFEVAEERLHVSMIPSALPCREAEFEELYYHLESAIQDESGVCIYLSGVPGTGKTATVKAVLRELKEEVQSGELKEFDMVEINGMRLTDPTQAYTTLWKAISDQKVSAKQAESLLQNTFLKDTSQRKCLVVIMDELDLLITQKQSVVYNFFEWPNSKTSKLIVIAIANTMDLPERMLTNKPYKYTQLIQIIESRLTGLDCFSSDAVQFCARKVGAVSGDARRCLDICRRAIEIFSLRSDRDTLVTMDDIKSAIKEMTTSSTVKALQHSTLHQLLFLLSCIKQSRLTGLSELSYRNIIEEHQSYCHLYSKSSPTMSVFHAISSYLGYYQLLTLEVAKSGDFSQKIKLNVDEQDVFLGIKQGDNKVLKTIVDGLER